VAEFIFKSPLTKKKQRVFVARALYRKPGVLFMD